MERLGVVVKPEDFGRGVFAAFNPACCYQPEDKLVILFVRTVDPDNGSMIHRVDLDEDNLSIRDIDPEPVLKAELPQENKGCEDPRLVKIAESDEYLMSYVAASQNQAESTKNNRPARWTTCNGLATSTDLRHFTRKSFFPDTQNNKDFVPLGIKVHGHYIAYHRRHPNIWIAKTDDFVTWYDYKKVLTTRRGSWDCRRVGANCAEIIDEGILLIYHGCDDDNVYRVGASLFDLFHPEKLLAQTRKPLFEPQEPYELYGIVPRVFFPCGTYRCNGYLRLTYGAADRVCAIAEASLKEILRSLVPIAKLY